MLSTACMLGVSGAGGGRKVKVGEWEGYDVELR